MGILSALFSSDKIIETGTKGIYNGIDMAIFTEEEKAEVNQKILNWKLEYYKATAPQNISRRYIAVIVTLLWALLVIVNVSLSVAGLYSKSEFVFTVLTDVVLQPFSIIIGFYFLGHALKGLKGN